MPTAGGRQQRNIEIQKRIVGVCRTIAANDPNGAPIAQLSKHIFIREMEMSDGSGSLQRMPVGRRKAIDIDASGRPVRRRQDPPAARDDARTAQDRVAHEN